MGTEYKVTVSRGINSILSLDDFKRFKSFWKKDEQYGNYYLGQIPHSDWPEIMVWEKENALGITLNGGNSEAWHELESFIKELKENHPDLEITDWDSGEDLSEEFFSD